jgi:hypothetical protein
MAEPQLEIARREVTDEVHKVVSPIEIGPPPTQKRPLRFGGLELSSRDFIEGPRVTTFVSDGVKFGKVGKFRGCH